MKELHAIASECDVPIVVSEGGRHTIVRIGSRVVAIPRHREINELLAKSIIREVKAYVEQ